MLEGRCLCGGIEYEIDGEVGPIGFCHCSYCRRASGSAFASNATSSSAAFKLRSGEALLKEFESTPGKLRSFCSRCGSPIYARVPALPEILRIRVGTLTSDPISRPGGHYDVASKAVWFTITDELPQSPT
ncbi:MAG: GFA family protein [Myxococcota bacterium]